MDTLEAGLHENAPPLVAQHMRGTFRLKHPPYTPKLRNWQTLQDGHGRNTVARTLRPLGHSETRVEIITKNGFNTTPVSHKTEPRLSVLLGEAMDDSPPWDEGPCDKRQVA